MRSKYQVEHSFETRKHETEVICKKFPDRFPVICEKDEGSEIPTLDRMKYIVKCDNTVGQLIYIIRTRIKLAPEKAIFIFVGDVIPPTSALIRSIYAEHKNEDGYLAYSHGGTDHFYTTNANEHANAVNNLGYSEEGVTGYVFATQGKYTTALYRMYNPNIQDHFYTTSAPERSNAISNLGYRDEGIAGYVYPDGNCGGLPLWRLYSDSATDHFYTMSTTERDRASNSLGYAQEGNSGYILPY